MTAEIAPRRYLEPTSPFLGATSAPVPVVPRSKEPPLALDLLRSPERLLAKMESPTELRRVVLAAVGTVVASAVVVGLVVIRGELADAVRGAFLLAQNLLFALAASIGPVYAAAIVLAARVPLARLVVILLCSTATGAMVLVALCPAPWFLMSVDREWLGSGSLLAAFTIAGIAAGARLHTTLLLFAREAKGAILDDEEEGRVKSLARLASVVIGANVALALWGFDALVS